MHSLYGHPDMEGFDDLEELALDLIWSWNRDADKLWQQLDPELFDYTHNPWVILQTVSREKLKKLLSDPSFRKSLKELIDKDAKFHQKGGTWFDQNPSQTPLKAVAYFSMEFMLSEALPIYSGGLGNVAGDQLKAASDLGVPVIGIGLLYQQGYFRQVLDREGSQQALYPYNSPMQLPISPLRKADGEWLRIEIKLPGWSLWLRTWQVKIGRVKLYLLDSNDAANYPPHRGITSELYGGDSEMRLKQELVLGIGGWRLLEMLGISPEVCHLNEGHAAFAILERAKEFMQDTGQSFATALAATRVGNLFTTHTAVPAGFDRFSPCLIERYLSEYAKQFLGLNTEQLLALGRQNPQDPDEPFNMAYLAARGSGCINGVSRLHGEVSRAIFKPLFPRRPPQEVPIGYVTNGIHTPSWDCGSAEELWTEFCGPTRWMGETEELEKNLRKASDAKLWNMRNRARKETIEYGRDRASRIWAARGYSPEEIVVAKTMFSTDCLTIGFARRFATYKRPNMLLHDKERLARLLTNSKRPVQLILAGKAHPADKPGQAMIQEWIQFLNRPDVRPHAIFLSDYNMLMAEKLVQGVDLWINTPRRPWEACGTSGMKVLVNGGLNLSELDGWWAEAYTPEVGWAIGDGQEHGNDPEWDAREACQLYDLLEREIVPCFYERNQEGIPTAWVARIRESMARLTPQYSANRAVREYTTQHYIPAAENFRRRCANREEKAKKIADWQQSLDKNWASLCFEKMNVKTSQGEHHFEVQIHFGGLDPTSVKVELCTIDQDPIEMKRSGDAYRASVNAQRPASDYCPRIVPFFPDAAVPLESSYILWQR